MKKNVNHFRTSKTFRMLSETNGMMSTSDNQNQKSRVALKKRLSAMAKQNEEVIQHIFC